LQLEDLRHVAASAAVPSTTAWRGRGPTDLSFACAVCRSPEAFRQIVRGPVRSFLPHKGLIAALGQGEGGDSRLRRLVGIDVQARLLDEKARCLHPVLEGMVEKWFRTREPLLQRVPWPSGPSSATLWRDTKVLPAGWLALHGEVDLYTRAWSYFFFTGMPDELHPSILIHRLQLIAPILMAPLSNVEAANASCENLIDDLNAGERQLLQWIVEGRSNPQIARFRATKLPMVRSQVMRLYMKLGVKNRVEAIRLASPICMAVADREAGDARP